MFASFAFSPAIDGLLLSVAADPAEGTSTAGRKPSSGRSQLL